MDDQLSFGAWVKRRRKALDLTQDDLARQVGCSVSTIVKIEADVRRPSRQIATLLATRLEIPAEQTTNFVRFARGEKRPQMPPAPPGLALNHASALPKRRTNLPNPAYPLIGRDAERDQIIRLLTATDCRLLTLTGPGGIGKTRLAHEVGLHLAEDGSRVFPDGVFVVPLETVRSSGDMIPALADAIELAVSSSQDLRARLLRELEGKQILLILDNMEHILDGVLLISELLERAPGIRLLVSSQERLYLAGEWVFELKGLPVPPPGQVESLEAYASVRLFLHAARQAKVSFQPKADDLEAIAQICRALEGMPLGIQLAAAWIRTLSPVEILAEMERAGSSGGVASFLAAPSRDAPERHRSLQAVMDYAWQRLSLEERRLLARLAVFAGGFQRQAAEQVADASLPLLAALVDKSMLETQGNGRYSMHELIRQYARQRLKEDPREEQALQDRHCSYYSHLLKPYLNQLVGRTGAQLQTLMSVEQANFRQAWRCALAQRRAQAIQFLGQGFSWFYELRGWIQEGLTVFREATDVLSELESEPARLNPQDRLSLALVLAGYGWFLNRHGRNTPAKSFFLRSLVLLRSGEYPDSLANLLRYIGMLDYQIGEFSEARSYLNESLEISQRLHYPYGQALCHSHLGMVAYALGDLPQSRRHFEAALQFWQELNEPFGLGYCLHHLSQVVSRMGGESDACSQAGEVLQQALEYSLTADDAWGSGATLNHLGLWHVQAGDLEAASRAFRQAAISFDKIGDPYDLAQSCIYLGDVYYRQGNYMEAAQAYAQGYTHARQAESLPLVFEALAGAAQARLDHLNPNLVGVLIDRLREHPATMYDTRSRLDQLSAQNANRKSDRPAEASFRQPDSSALSLVELAGLIIGDYS